MVAMPILEGRQGLSLNHLRTDIERADKRFGYGWHPQCASRGLPWYYEHREGVIFIPIDQTIEQFLAIQFVQCVKSHASEIALSLIDPFDLHISAGDNFLTCGCDIRTARFCANLHKSQKVHRDGLRFRKIWVRHCCMSWGWQARLNIRDEIVSCRAEHNQQENDRRTRHGADIIVNEFLSLDRCSRPVHN